jgi:hypothetical protein
MAHTFHIPPLTFPIPQAVQAHPIDLVIPASLETCAERLLNADGQAAENICTSLTPISETNVRFHISKHIGRFFEVEASGYLVRHADSITVVVGQSRLSAHTYIMPLLMAVLALLFMQSLFGLLFMLLFLRMAVTIIVSGTVCKDELTQYIESTLTHT